MKNQLQQYLLNLALTLALVTGGLLSSAEVFGALPGAPEVEAEKLSLSDVVAERDGGGLPGKWIYKYSSSW